MHTLYKELWQSLASPLLSNESSPQESNNLERRSLSTVLIENSDLASLTNRDKVQLEQLPLVWQIIVQHPKLKQAIAAVNDKFQDRLANDAR